MSEAEFQSSPLPLNGLRVGISGAVPERELWGDVRDLDRLILSFVAQLSALVVRYGGQVVHGSQPLLTPVVAEQVRGQGPKGTVPLNLFASKLFGDLPEVTMRAMETAGATVTLTKKLGEGDARDPHTRNHSLTAMRLAMIQDVDVLVAIGGKLHVDTGFNPGVLEELAQARWHGVPTFIVGSYGGAAGHLDKQLLTDLSGDNLLGPGQRWYEKPEVETTGLAMAKWTDQMDEYAGKLLLHFVRNQEQFRRGSRLEHTPAFTFQSLRVEDERRVGTPLVVDVDPKVVAEWAQRFADLTKAVANRDTDQSRALLRNTSQTRLLLKSTPERLAEN